MRRLFQNMENRQKGSVRGIVVLDNGVDPWLRIDWPQMKCIIVPGHRMWSILNGPSLFVATQAFNLGFQAYPEDDVVVLMDDVEILTDNWALRIEQLFRHWPNEYGILTLCETSTTEGQPAALNPRELEIVAFGSSLLIPRRVLNHVGPWDPSFVGYGFDDFDYAIRCWHKGYKIGVAGDILLHNAAQATGWVEKLGSYEKVLEKQDINAAVFYTKWYNELPSNLRDIKRPHVAYHFKRQGCKCLERDHPGLL